MAKLSIIVNDQRAYHQTGATLPVGFRLEALKRLKSAIIANEGKIMAALKQDLNKSGFEAYATEIGMVLEELNFTLRNLRKWCKRTKVKTPLAHFPAKSFRVPEPYGVVLIMSPWNYPFQLTLAPLIGALAAGNCALAKPSAYAPQTAEIINQILTGCFEQKYVAVVKGGREVNQALLKQKFDYIFFTGSTQVGKLVMKAASNNLTPVTLELGGKSPCIVDKSANLDLAAKRIVWGKFLNAGQTCVAPDYLMVENEVVDELLEGLKKYIAGFFGPDPLANPDFPRIVNEKHFERLTSYLSGATIAYGGKSNPESLAIAPTILINVSWDDAAMQEEIFGPLLPVLTFGNLEEVITLVNSKPKPLALYLFCNNKEVEKTILERTSFGGGCINDTIVHLATSHMPFGGVGQSGMGSYHGKWSFDTFSHYKSILKKSALIDIPLRYPPYSKEKLRWIRKFMGGTRGTRGR